jgi:hypothetical protein
VWPRGEAVISLGNGGSNSKQKTTLEKIIVFRKQEEFEDKKILSKRKASLGHLSRDVCQERKTSTG